MASLRVNTLANLVGMGAVASTYLLVLPIYLRQLGAEAFGFVGLFFTLASISAAMDLGFGAALNRQLTQLVATEGKTKHLRTALRTYESVVWLMSLVFALILYSMSSWLIDSWLLTGSLDKGGLLGALRWMIAALALQLPLSLYTNALWGLQKQLSFNTSNVILVAVRLIGGAALLTWWDASLTHFFVWQAGVTALHVAVMASLAWVSLPHQEERAQISLEMLGRSRQFVADVAMATLMATFLTQIDKLMLSKLFVLKDYGYYIMAWSIASLLGRLAGPIYAAWTPRMTQYVAQKNSDLLRQTYLRGLKLLTVLVLPIGIILGSFSYSILLAYTGDEKLATAASIPLMLLTFGSACNALLLMPHALALAHGWTRLSVIQNALACVLVIPIVYLGIRLWGLQGAAVGWAIVNALLLACSVPLVHKHCLTVPRTTSKWFPS
jgi:O-antigen/teichoic acid export membrane protein